MKDAVRPEPMAFRFESVDLGFLDSEGEPVTSAVLVDAQGGPHVPASRTSGLGVAQRRILTMLVDEYERCRANLSSRGFDSEGARVTTERWKELIKEKHHRNVMHKAINSLTDRGLVRIDGYHAILGDTE